MKVSLIAVTDPTDISMRGKDEKVSVYTFEHVCSSLKSKRVKATESNNLVRVLFCLYEHDCCNRTVPILMMDDDQ